MISLQKLKQYFKLKYELSPHHKSSVYVGDDFYNKYFIKTILLHNLENIKFDHPKLPFPQGNADYFKCLDCGIIVYAALGGICLFDCIDNKRYFDDEIKMQDL